MTKPTAKKAEINLNQVDLLHETKKDLNPFWSSSLFSDVYLKNDLPREYKSLWENDEYGPYYEFYQGFINLCHASEHESFENWREADTVKNWIVPIMSLLGWENNSERHQNSYIDNTSFTVLENGKKQVYRPDLVYFDQPQHKAYTQKEKESEAKLREIRDKNTGAKIVVEAKYWNRLAANSDKYKNKESDDSASGLGPELQTLKYMELFGHDFGILTDGKTWKLFHKDLSQGMERRCFEFDVGNLIEVALDLGRGTNEQKFRNYTKYFFYFFSKNSLVQSKGSKTNPFVYEVLEYSKKYASSIEEDLKKRFLLTMGITCNAINESVLKSKEGTSLEQIRNVAESHLFNILFVKSCEVRRILPIQSINYLKVSLHEVIEALAEMNFDPEKNWDDYLRDFRFGPTFGGKSFSFEGYEIFNRFINLYEVIHDGTSVTKDFGFEISGFKESIFSKDEWKFAKKHRINNKSMIQILFNLNFIESRFPGRKYQQIPYSYFSPRQLGSIYESFLEYRLEIAPSDLIFHKSKWTAANLKSEQVKKLRLVDSHVAKKGELFFSPNNKDRKMTGSYYTPDYVVNYIIENTITPIIKSKSSKEILQLKICDPAMGSGHFLSGVLDFLVKSYRKKWSEENNDDIEESVVETSRTILDSCIFGVDINPRAVKLAKMSLWLLTAYPGKKLERLCDQMQCSDGLFVDVKKLLKRDEGFDAIVMNPPYISELRGNSELFQKYAKSPLTQRYYEDKIDIFYLFICRSLDYLKAEGNLGCIVEQYWLSRAKTQKLHKKMHEEAYLYKHVDFKSYAVFREAPGVHSSILIMSKDKSLDRKLEKTINENVNSEEEAQRWLNSNAYKETDIVYDESLKRFTRNVTDNNSYDYIHDHFVQLGIDTHQEFVSTKHSELYPNLKKGDGIFVVSEIELRKMNLSDKERSYVKIFYDAKQVEPFQLKNGEKKYLLYISASDNKLILEGKLKIPGIVKHLNKFEKIITSDSKPYGLHRARQEKWFAKGSKVLSVRKTKYPKFYHTEDEFFCNQSMVIIQTNNLFLDKLLTIVLNSKFAHDFFASTKTQGDQLQIDKEVLLKFPFPKSIELNSFDESTFKKQYSEVYKIVNSGKTIKKEDVEKVVQLLYSKSSGKKKAA